MLGGVCCGIGGRRCSWAVACSTPCFNCSNEDIGRSDMECHHRRWLDYGGHVGCLYGSCHVHLRRPTFEFRQRLQRQPQGECVCTYLRATCALCASDSPLPLPSPPLSRMKRTIWRFRLSQAAGRAPRRGLLCCRRGMRRRKKRMRMMIVTLTCSPCTSASFLSSL